jgi:hypothetical protein
LIENNVATRTIFYLKVILRGLYEHAGRFFNLSFTWRNVFQANVLRFTLINPMLLQTHPSFVCLFQMFQNKNSELKVAMCCAHRSSGNKNFIFNLLDISMEFLLDFHIYCRQIIINPIYKNKICDFFQTTYWPVWAFVSFHNDLRRYILSMDYQNLPKIMNSTWKRNKYTWYFVTSVMYHVLWKGENKNKLKGRVWSSTSICLLYRIYAKLRSKQMNPPKICNKKS